MTSSMKTLHIAMIGVRGIPATSGGAEVVVEALAEELVKRGHQVTVYCRPHYQTANTKTWKDIRLKSVRCINTKHLEAITHAFFCSIHAAFSHYDIIHYHSVGPSLMVWIPRLTGKTVISTCHGLDWKREKWGNMAKFFLRLGGWASAHLSNRTTVVSEPLNRYYSRTYKRQTRTIPNGVSHDETKKESKILEQHNLEKDGYILFLSRIVPEKGLHFLIEAYSLMETNKKLVVAGDSSHSSQYQREILKKACADKRIIFTGAVYGEDKRTLFSSAYLFVLPSTIEGMPVVLLEALSCGCVPVVSNLMVNQSIVKNKSKNYGYLFRKRNVSDLRETLEFALNHMNEVKVKQIEMVRLKTRFNWKSISERYVEVYQSAREVH
jgi:glycosyltransferase involved in cell wall biosynthesis